MPNREVRVFCLFRNRAYCIVGMNTVPVPQNQQSYQLREYGPRGNIGFLSTTTWASIWIFLSPCVKPNEKLASWTIVGSILATVDQLIDTCRRSLIYTKPPCNSIYCSNAHICNHDESWLKRNRVSSLVLEWDKSLRTFRTSAYL